MKQGVDQSALSRNPAGRRGAGRLDVCKPRDCATPATAAGVTMRRRASPALLLLALAALAAHARAWDMSMTSLADKLGDVIAVKGIQQGSIQSKLPLVLNVWPFVNATMAGWAALNNASSSTPWLDAVERVRGCHNLQGIGMCAITAAATAATAAATPAAATAVS